MGLATLKSWLDALRILIKWGPQVVQLVSEIVELFTKHRTQLAVEGASPDRLEHVAAEQHKDLMNAVATQRATGDWGPLHELRDKQRAACRELEARQMGPGGRK